MEQDEISEILNSDCASYLECLRECKKGLFLLRAYFYQIDTIKKFEHNVNYRKPRNMAPDIHDKINEYFSPLFKWKIRNGIFCYGFDILNTEPIDLGYGIFYLFFPIGEFKYVYSPHHFDLFGYINQTKMDITTLITRLEFRDDNLCKGMSPRKEYDNFSNEISVNAKTYYLVNIKHAKYLISKIWWDCNHK